MFRGMLGESHVTAVESLGVKGVEQLCFKGRKRERNIRTSKISPGIDCIPRLLLPHPLFSPPFLWITKGRDFNKKGAGIKPQGGNDKRKKKLIIIFTFSKWQSL